MNNCDTIINVLEPKSHTNSEAHLAKMGCYITLYYSLRTGKLITRAIASDINNFSFPLFTFNIVICVYWGGGGGGGGGGPFL